MSYLKQPSGIPDFSKAVISLWFRVPQASIATAANADQDNVPREMSGTISLLTFGKAPIENDMEPISANIGVAVNFPQERCPPVISISGYQVAVQDYQIPPSFIGIDCAGGVPRLVFRLQLAELSNYANSSWASTRMEVYDLAAVPPPFPGNFAPWETRGSGWNSLSFPFVGQASPLVDFSFKANWYPNFYLVRPNSPIITPDQWHHLLLSFDISAGCSTRSRPYGEGTSSIASRTEAYGKLWFALDDVNYDGPDNLGPFFVTEGSDQNAILTNDCHSCAKANTFYIYNFLPPVATCSITAPIPSSDSIIGIPAGSPAVENNIYRVEMAEFQLFTDVTLNTGDKDKRRAFVDADGKPVKPAETERIMRQRPAVLLNGNSNWQAGYNTGSTGVVISPDGEITKLPAGQFTPVAGIEKYKPEPALGA